METVGSSETLVNTSSITQYISPDDRNLKEMLYFCEFYTILPFSVESEP